MVDPFKGKKRSEIMSRIRGRDTSLERKIGRALRESGLKPKSQYGPFKADFAFPRAKIAVFLDSCFWHNCPKHRSYPATNPVFWKRKLEANRARDIKTTKKLKAQGWTVLRFWEHECKDPRRVVMKIKKALDQRVGSISEVR